MRPTQRYLQGDARFVFVAVAAAILLAAACATTADTGDDAVVPPRDGDTSGDAVCPDACPPGTSCVRGHCVPSSCSGGCPAGETCCGSVCVNTRSDPGNCGSCDNVCAPAGDTCLAGTCSCNGAAGCSTGRSCCPGLGCIDTMGDSAHCGSCDLSCPEGVECLAGACGGSCVTGCPDVPHGSTACAGESCAISACDDGWADVDGVVGNGCECAVTPEPEGGETCDTAIDLGEITEGGTALRAEGNIAPVDDDDWYTFTAVDTPETDCDHFYVDVRFESNPDDQFGFSVSAGNCGTILCPGDVLFTYATDFNDSTGTEIRGECPCTATPTPGQNMCHDSTQVFYIRVGRVSTSGGGTCDGYSLIITNATHSTADP
jgi:hypothetical protein